MGFFEFAAFVAVNLGVLFISYTLIMADHWFVALLVMGCLMSYKNSDKSKGRHGCFNCQWDGSRNCRGSHPDLTQGGSLGSNCPHWKLEEEQK